MTNDPRRFEAIAAAAARETVHSGDVSKRVLATSREQHLVRASTQPILVMAAGYAVACVIALIVSYQFGSVTEDPIAGFFAMASEIAP